MNTTQAKRPTLMLLSGARSYRAGAFHAAAQRLDIRVVPVVNMPREMAQRNASVFGVDFDQPAAARQIAARAGQEGVDAVLAVDDSGTLVAAQVAQILGLPHNSPASAQAARDKDVMRRRMAAAGVPCPWFQRFSTHDAIDVIARQVPYPCVIKPLALNGSRGVIRADDAPTLAAAVARLRRLLEQEYGRAQAHSYLIESFIPGVEVALEGLLNNGRLQVLALFDKPDPLDGPFFEETIYVTPSRLPRATQDAIYTCVARAAQALGLVTGPIHAELRINEDGPWMLEAAGRSIGGLCAQTLRFGVNASLEELIVRQVCGLALPEAGVSQASGVMMIPIPHAGIFLGVHGMEAALAVPGIEDIQITAKPHYSITPLPEGESYLGFIFARDDTPARAEAALRHAHRLLRIEIAPEFSLSG